MKGISKFIHSMGRLCMPLLLVLSFFLTLPARAIVNWEDQSVAPAAGQFYIYNAESGYFLLYNGNNTNASITNSPITAEGKYFTLSNATSVSVRISNSNRSCTISAVNGANYQLEYTTSGSWNWSCFCYPTIYNYVYTNGSSLSTNTSTTGNYNRWVFIPKATFDALKHTYNANFAAHVGSAGGGSAKVGLTNPLPGNATEEASISGVYFGDDYAYVEAIASTNHEFVGWARDAAGTRMIDGAVNTLYPVLIPNNDGSEQDVFTYYAIFEPVSPYEAQLVHYTDFGEEEITQYNLLSEAITAAASYDKVQILKNINLASAVTISKNLTLDLNGFSLRGSSNLLVLNSGNLTITDGNIKTSNGFILNTTTTSTVSAIEVSGGTLTFAYGRIYATNNSTGVTSGILVANGNLVMQGNGGVVNMNAANGYGVQVAATKTATLAQGTINAEGGAIGVLANGTVKITHSIKVNASNSSTIGVRINHANADVVIDGGVITATTIAIQAQNGKVECKGSMEAKVTANSSAYALKQEGSTAEVTVRTGRFYTPSDNAQDVIAATVSKLKLYGGYYVHNTALNMYKQEGVGVAELKSGTTFYTQGYRYVLSDGENPNYIAYTANNKNFSSLADALDYANTNPNTTMTILQVVPEHILPAGNYTLPAKATLLIPYMGQTSAKTSIERIDGTDGSTPSVANRLTFQSGVNIDVKGSIELGGKQMAGAQGATGAGAPRDSYGLLVMETGSRMTLSGSSANLRAWGFVMGDGEIDVRSGAKVYEQFQMYDWKGGTGTSMMYENSGKVFPVTQYFIQNVETKTTYHPGANLYGVTSVQISDYKLAMDNIDLIGVSGSLFLLKNEHDQENTWVRKYYDATTDQQVYEVNSSASLGSLVIDLSSSMNAIIDAAGWIGGGVIRAALALAGIDPDHFAFDSRKYILPITNNMKIKILSGNMDITQNTVLLPGSEIEVDKEARVTILDEANVNYDGALYLVDADQWQAGHVYSGAYTSQVLYTASHKGKPNKRGTITSGNFTFDKPADAKMFVHGTLDVQGVLYTTTNDETTIGGANIISTIADAGTIVLNHAAPSVNGSIKLFSGLTGSKTDTEIHYATYVTPSAWLTNEKEGVEPTKTAGKGKGFTYCFLDVDGDQKGEWTSLSTMGCFVRDEAANPVVYYAKPKEYVRVNVTVLHEDDPNEDIEYIGITDNNGNDTHTYSYVSPLYGEGGDTVLICMDDCQWWKVVKVEEADSLVYCPTNGLYYYWATERVDQNNDYLPDGWEEKRLTVKWNNWDGSNIATYQQAYKSIPSYQGATPTRSYTDYYTYSFTGWMPEITPVMGDVVYTAQFAENDRKYTISFYDEDGETLIESQLCKIGDVPVCYNMPSKDGMRLEWLPYEPIAVSANGQHTYTASFTAEEKNEYTITFFDFNGDVLQTEEVAIGTLPVYDEATNGKPRKPKDGNKEFVWNGGWTPEIVPVDGNASYTATFDEVPAKYTITWQDKDGNEIEHADWGYGEMPICSNPPTQPSTEDYYYEVIWNPLVGVVTGNQTYRANGFTAYHNTCRLTISAGDHGFVTLDGSSDVLSKQYEYEATAVIVASADDHYHFVRWSDGSTDASRSITMTRALTLTAEFAIDQVQIIWNLNNGKPNEVQLVDYGVIPSHGTPVKDRTEGYTYSFTGWDSNIVIATENKTYTAQYAEIPNTYNVRFVFNNGREDLVRNYDYNTEPIIANPTKISPLGIEYTFIGWKNSADVLTNSGESNTTLPAVTRIETYVAQYSGELVSGDGNGDNGGQTITLDNSIDLNSLTIHADGIVEISAGENLTIGNLYIEATESSSGELIPINATASATNAYYDLTLNTWARHWHAFGVPWTVDIDETPLIEVKTKAGVETSRVLTMGRDYDILYYDGAVRAQYGPVPACWKYVNDEAHVLTPGRVYMIAFTCPVGTLRFAKKAGTSLLFSETLSVAKNTQSTGNTMDGGWNGIANPMTYHAVLNAGVTECQVYDSDSIGYDNYSMVNLTNKKFIVGKAVYVQVQNTQNVGISQASTQSPFAAPRRQQVADETDNRYDVHIAPLDGESADHIYVVSDENKEEDTYTIVADLAKFGMSTRKAHIWVNRYETRLAKNTIAPINGHADYPLGLYAPKEGEYTISLTYDPDDDQTMYLTLDGEAIWNLSESPYTLTLNKGIVNNYGLRIRAHAPQVVTGIDEAIVDAQGEIRKVLIKNQVYIIRGENVYTIDGQLVK